MISPLATLHPVWLAGVAIVPLAVFLYRRRQGSLARWVLPVAVIATALCVVLGLGVVEIPKLEDLPLERYVRDVGDALGNWAYALVGLLAFLETGAFVGLVAPGETFVLLGGVLAGEGALPPYVLTGVVWACAFAGDTVSFWLGRRLGRGFLERHGSRIKLTPERLERTEEFLRRHGGKAILIGRFIGFVRAVAPFIMGSSGVRFRRIAPYSLVGSGLWSALFVTLGFVFWRSLDQLLAWAKQGSTAFGAVLVIVVGGYAAWRWLHDPDNRRRARGWLTSRRGGSAR